MDDGLTIREMADRTGVGVHTLRYYEREGLLEPIARNDGGHRRYRESDVVAITFLTRMRATGMGISALREYVALARRGDASAAARRRMLDRHRATVCAKIAELETCVGAIDAKISMYERLEADSRSRKVAAVS